MKRCGVTGKVRYTDALAAGAALNRTQRQGVSVTHMYRCKSCRDWHLASDRIALRVDANELELIVMCLRGSAFDGTDKLADRIGRSVQTVPTE